jgi:putative membrane protein
MALVTDTDQRRIAEAIGRAEAGTTGEIVAVIAAESGSYLHVPFLWASIVALAVPLPLIFWTWWPIQTIYALQLMSFLVLSTVLMQRPLRYRMAPWAMKQARAHKRALEQFMAQNLHTTENHTGVLIFVSVAERYAEIIADKGIHERVAEGTWDRIVADLTTAIGEGRAGDGLVQAITEVGTHLAEHFPPGTRHEKGLPNHLILLPGAA